MSKKLKIFIEERAIPKTPRNVLFWLLCLLILLMLTDNINNSVFAQTCSNLKFPLTLGYTSGETEIISIDQDSFTGYLYIGGTTTATELKVSGASKSIFFALFDG